MNKRSTLHLPRETIVNDKNNDHDNAVDGCSSSQSTLQPHRRRRRRSDDDEHNQRRRRRSSSSSSEEEEEASFASSSSSSSCYSSSHGSTASRCAGSLTNDDDGIDNSSRRKVQFQSPYQHAAAANVVTRNKTNNNAVITKFDIATTLQRFDRPFDKPYQGKPYDSTAAAAAAAAAATKIMPMFYCPNCKTNQRDYINFATAATSINTNTPTNGIGRMLDVIVTPQGYLTLYFVLYLVASLFVFGLEEGWSPIDCVYFSVITLTTTGLGDFVPTSDGAKIVCTCFIYIGVATIGLLLGTLLVGSMDESSKREARIAQIRDCPNCAKLEAKLEKKRMLLIIQQRQEQRRAMMNGLYASSDVSLEEYEEEEESDDDEETEIVGLDICEGNTNDPQKTHTRHMSIDVGGGGIRHSLRRNFSHEMDVPHVDESTSFRQGIGGATDSLRRSQPTPSSNMYTLPTATTSTTTTSTRSLTDPNLNYNIATNDGGIIDSTKSYIIDDDNHSFASTSTTESTNSSMNPNKAMTRIKAAKYVFLTLRQALMNSIFIIAAGSVGFHYIEGMSAVDSFYFTTVLLTSVGYGDIVPVTTAGKLFTTIFTVIAGSVLLRNMSLISLIPLELRKRRMEIAVLGQFGSHLTDDELRELSTGRLIQRLKLATDRPDGLEECTREMFSLAMLVRLGRISEDDVKSTFAAFRRLDVGAQGKLNSRTVIEGEVMRRRSIKLSSRNRSSLIEDWRQEGINNNFETYSGSLGTSYHGSLPHIHTRDSIAMSRRHATINKPTLASLVILTIVSILQLTVSSADGGGAVNIVAMNHVSRNTFLKSNTRRLNTKHQSDEGNTVSGFNNMTKISDSEYDESAAEESNGHEDSKYESLSDNDTSKKDVKTISIHSASKKTKRNDGLHSARYVRNQSIATEDDIKESTVSDYLVGIVILFLVFGAYARGNGTISFPSTPPPIGRSVREGYTEIRNSTRQSR